MTIQWLVEANGQRLVVRGGNEVASPRAGNRVNLAKARVRHPR